MVSEFLLQQTTVAAVRPRFAKWMQRFPSPAAMAAVAEAEVFAMWQGLGYYRRARLLHQASRAIVEKHQGRVPRDQTKLRALPGVGDYTAAAILAFAYDEPVPVLDANIQRVASRLANITSVITSREGRQAAETVVRQLLPPKKGGRAVISALMDLGAQVCRPRAPRCHLCPLREICRAEEPEKLPRRRPKMASVEVTDRRAWAFQKGKVALTLSPGPWWKGMWVLPASQSTGQPLHIEHFAVTRHRVRMEVFAAGALPAGAEWFPAHALPPLPSPHLRALRALLEGSAEADKKHRSATLPSSSNSTPSASSLSRFSRKASCAADP